MNAVLNAMLTGLFTGFCLIVAIGAQNAFVIRQGLAKKYVALVVAICALSDTVLILAGVGGLGAVIHALPWLLWVFKYLGSAYLFWFGIKSVMAAVKADYLDVQTGSVTTSMWKVAGTCLMFTWLNPHVYLDTVIFLGGVANQFSGERWWFAFGASAASWIWFVLLGYGARMASRWMRSSRFWRILDSIIAGLMFALAVALLLSK